MTDVDRWKPDPEETLLAACWASLTLVIVLVASMWIGGCTASLQQRILTAQAEVLVSTQDGRYEVYDVMHAGCVREPTLEQYERCMLPAEAMARSVDTYEASLYAAQRVLTATGSVPANRLACLALAAADVQRGLLTAGIDVPDEVREFAQMATEGMTCAE